MDEFIRAHGHHLVTALFVFVYVSTKKSPDGLTAAAIAGVADYLAEVYFVKGGSAFFPRLGHSSAPAQGSAAPN